MSELDQPKVIETGDVLSLREEVTLTDVIQAEVRSMPFHLLTPDQFELLLWDLFYSNCNDTDLEFDNARLMITGADQGRDVWLTDDGEPSGLIQCKREDCNVKKASHGQPRSRMRQSRFRWEGLSCPSFELCWSTVHHR